MTPKAISDRTIQLSMVEAEKSEIETRNGIYLVRTRGRLDNNRVATVRVSQRGEMITVGLMVPGMGNMSISFSLFAEDATEERVERYLTHYIGLHKEAKDKWELSKTITLEA